MSSAVLFRQTRLDILTINGQPWLRGAQIGRALGYRPPDKKIDRLYARHAFEFTDAMTRTETLPESGHAPQRLFSPRGCHLLGLLSRSALAREFRIWVLDVLEKHRTVEAGKPQAELVTAVESPERCPVVPSSLPWSPDGRFRAGGPGRPQGRYDPAHDVRRMDLDSLLAGLRCRVNDVAEAERRILLQVDALIEPARVAAWGSREHAMALAAREALESSLYCLDDAMRMIEKNAASAYLAATVLS